jgi:hypothetical protein
VEASVPVRTGPQPLPSPVGEERTNPAEEPERSAGGGEEDGESDPPVVSKRQRL